MGRGERLLARFPRGQIAMEYLLIVGFAMLLILPLIIVYVNQSTRLGDAATDASVARAATQLVEAADTVYYLGAPSTRTIVIDIPDTVTSVSLNGKAISFRVSSSHNEYEQVAWSTANLSGTFSVSSGPHVLVLTALENGTVSVSE